MQTYKLSKALIEAGDDVELIKKVHFILESAGMQITVVKEQIKALKALPAPKEVNDDAS